MGYLGYKPADKPLTSADITDSIITSAKIADGTIVNADINASAAIAGTKISGSFGKVLQVVQQVYDTFAQTNSQSYIDTGLTLAITPSSSSNKILVIVSANYGTNTAAAQTISNDLLRAGSSIRTFETVLQAGSAISGQVSYTYLDSPSTTSSTTYKIQYKGSAGTGQYIRLNNYAGGSTGSASTLTLMEIAA